MVGNMPLSRSTRSTPLSRAGNHRGNGDPRVGLASAGRPGVVVPRIADRIEIADHHHAVCHQGGLYRVGQRFAIFRRDPNRLHDTQHGNPDNKNTGTVGHGATPC